MEDEYFLTDHQRNIKDDIIKIIEKNSDTYNILGIEGNPGTGKTLLIYDLYKELFGSSYNVLIVHCGKYNEGQKILKSEYGFKIKSIGSINIQEELGDYDIIICDEFQRIRGYQLEKILQIVKEMNKTVIFSFDPKQCLSKSEINLNFKQILKREETTPIFKLSGKIRTNHNIAQFITCLFDLKKMLPNNKVNKISECVKIEYFDNKVDALKYIKYLRLHDWTTVSYTSSNYNVENIEVYRTIADMNAHDVIGQEFDNVLAIIDNNFYYDDNNLIQSREKYYDLNGMLFQITTRTRHKLCLVIINNKSVFEKALEIVNFYESQFYLAPKDQILTCTS